MGCMHIWVGRLLIFVVGLVIICGFCISTVSYIKIYKTVRRHRNAIQVQLQVVQVSSGNATNMARLKKSALNTFIVYIVFALCYIPFVIALAVTTYFPNDKFLARYLAATFVFMNSMFT